MDIKLNIHSDCFPETVKRLWITDGWALTVDRALDHRQTALKLIQAPVNSCPLPPEVEGWLKQSLNQEFSG